MRNMHCLQTQTRLLSIFYVCFVVLDFILMGVGNHLFVEDRDFTCLNETVLKAANNSGATFLLVYTLFLLSFTLMLWFVFYALPDHFGLISRKLQRLDIKQKDMINDDFVDNLVVDITKEEEESFRKSSPMVGDRGLRNNKRYTTSPNMQY